MSMRLEAVARVQASPVHTAFPWPVQPEFSYTDFPQIFGVHSSRDAKDFKFDPVAECLYPDPMYIPHNQAMSGYDWTLGSLARDDNLQLNWFITALTSNIDTAYVKECDGSYVGPVNSPGNNVYGGTLARYLNYGIDWQSWYDDNSGPSWTELPLVPSFTLIAKSNLSPHSHVTGAMGFYGFIRRGWNARVQLLDDAGGGILDTEEPSFTGYMSIRFQVGQDDPDSIYYYEIQFPPVGDPVIRRARESNFSDVVALYQSDQTGEVDRREGTFGGPSAVAITGAGETQMNPLIVAFGYRYERVEVLLIGGYLEIKIESGDTPFVWRHMVYETLNEGTEDEVTQPVGRIHELRVTFGGCNFCSWYLNPIKFKPHAQWDSNWINVGFTPVNEPTITPYDAFYKPLPPEDYTITTDFTVEGQNVRYSLVFDNAIDGIWTALGSGLDYSNLTRAVRATRVKFEEVLSEPFGQIVELYPEDVAINWSLNLNERCIESTARLVFNNFGDISRYHVGGPDWPWGQWANYAGQIAVAIDVMMTYYNHDGTVNQATGWQRMFTGYGNVKSTATIEQGGQSKYTMICVDRSLSMKSPRFYLPWMDGWNEYYFAAYLANIAGVKRGTVGDSDLYFRDKVPDDPEDDSPGGGAYFLPLGVGGSPLVKHSAGSAPWDTLGKIAKLTGFLRYFDNYGLLHYERFTPTPSEPVKYLFGHHNFNLVAFNPHNAIFNGSVTRDMTEVRTSTTIIGIDAHGLQWSPIASHITDQGAIFDTRANIWEPAQINILGYDNAFVMVDSIFANQEFADAAAQRSFEVFRLPGIDGGVKCWLQTDLFPGMFVAVVDARSGLWDPLSGALAPMLVMGCGHHIRKGEIPTSTLDLKFFPEVTETANEGTLPTIPAATRSNTVEVAQVSGPTTLTTD